MSEHKTKVTILVPTYNVEAYIEKCILSLLSQDYEYLDIHIINDGSPANEYEIIKPYLNKYPKKLRYTHKENGGYGSVLSLGVQSSDADYILVCDPDDYLEPQAITKLVTLAKNNDADIVCSARFDIYSDANEKHYNQMFNSSHALLEDKKVYIRGTKSFSQVYLIENAPHGKLYKRTLLTDLEFPHKTNYTDVILFFGAVFNSQKVIYTSEAMANYLIVREGNSMTNIKPKSIDDLNLAHHVILDLSEKYSDIDATFYFQMLIAFHYIFFRCEQIDGNENIKKEKLLETTQLLKFLINHRHKILKYYFSLPQVPKMDVFKNALLLQPFSSNYAINILINNRIKDGQNSIQNQVHSSQIETFNGLVSIIVPIYNVEEYLDRCLKTLVKQTYQNIEIICVNDGTKDNSQLIIDDYVTAYPKIVKSFTKVNGGLSDARNFGLEKATGEYVLYVDSDDFVDLDYVEKMIKPLSYDKDIDVVVCDMVYEYDTYSEKSCGGLFKLTDFSENPSLIQINNSACNKLIKYSLAKEHLFPLGLWYEDLATIPIILAKAKKVAKVDEALYHYVQREGSIVHTENPKIFEIYKAIDKIAEQVKHSDHKIDKIIKRLYIQHGANNTTLRIRYYKNNRSKYIKENRKNLSKRYPFWYFDRFTLKFGLKKWLMFTLLYFGLDNLLMKLYDMKEQR